MRRRLWRRFRQRPLAGIGLTLSAAVIGPRWEADPDAWWREVGGPQRGAGGQADLERMHKESHQYIDLLRVMRPITKWNARISDAAIIPEVVRKAFKQTGLYLELMRPFGVRDVMKVFLPPHHGVSSVLVFDTSGSGFRETDRVLVRRLVPALIRFQQNAQLRSQAVSADHRLRLLTPRELTVLARAAAGETNAEISGALFINPSTVRKHLEHIYEKLAVRNRAAAAGVYARARSS
jgi:DNA-binding CsgD family transcriptional regulator